MTPTKANLVVLGHRNWFRFAASIQPTYFTSPMARENQLEKIERTKKIIAGLAKTYPDAHCELDHSNPLQLLVATILSAQCTDKRVNLVTATLFKQYPTAAAFAAAKTADLENAIKSTGFFRNKARSIKACCEALVQHHKGEVPNTMEALIKLGGVGRKTANVVLGNAFGVNVGVVVDTHVARLSNRMGLTREKAPEKIETALMQIVPQPQWAMFSHWLIWHGRRRCFARTPDCARCEILALCPRVGVKVSTLPKSPGKSRVPSSARA